MGFTLLGGQELLGHTWASIVGQRAVECPGQVAFHICGPDWDSDLSFGLWHELATSLARTLAHLGIGRGDRVAALSSGSVVWPVVQVACSHLGAILVPVNSRYRHGELVFVLGMAKPKVVFLVERLGEADIWERVANALLDIEDFSPKLVAFPSPNVTTNRHRVSPDGEWLQAVTAGVLTWQQAITPPSAIPEPKPAAASPRDAVLLQFTSGTTSFPKGALLDSASTLRATYELGRRMGLTESDVMYSTQPMYHVGGSVATTLMAPTIGCAMVVPERYTAEETFRLVEKYSATARTGQAAMYLRELHHRDFSPRVFRTVTKGWSGGSALMKQQIVEKMGIPDLISTYGLTESAAVVTACDSHDPLQARLASSGRALPGLEVAISVDGEMLTGDTPPGEVCVRGWSVMLGYFSDSEATAEAIDAQGWLHTGDLGRLDGQGFIYIIDRIKEMLKPGGENVSPAEVERVIAQLPQVAAVAVVGMPDDKLGEVPCAFVENPDGTLSEEAVTGFCTRQMASFKVPRKVIFVDTWPMTGSGKIAKGELRKQVADKGLGIVGRTG
ncbi:MAG: AMP-binding protein [Propionibacteriaceae bacterium]|jgi:acyl-CoA synthetase (AMP-forming)/AMP-acid ligase II|nr:AMP-binding protein [Propionibacteriaceae bacterium]